MDLRTYADRDMMFIDLANQLAGELGNCLRRHRHASFAVPGGTTPGPVFDALCAADLDWDRVHVFLTDERWVPEDHDRSNTRLVRERLLTGRAAEATLVPMVTDDARPEEGIPKLLPGFYDELPISVMLLGMGADMHCASLFPGAPELGAALSPEAPVLVPVRPAGQPEARVTLSAPVLDGALSKHIVVTGDDKRAALERARGLGPHEAPVTAVWNGAVVHWAA